MDLMKYKVSKKILLLILIIPGICVASPAVPFAHGFYLGASAAVNSTKVNNQLRFNSADVEDAALYNRDQQGSNSQVQPGFLVGYEHTFNHRWLVSGEFQANFLQSTINLSGTDYVSNVITVNQQYALQLRGGINLSDNDNTLYALVGVAQTRTGVAIEFDTANPTVGSYSELDLSPLNNTHTMSGLKLGLGYEKHVTNNIALRIDYSHTQYGSFNNELKDAVYFDIMGPMGKSKVSQSADMIGLGLMYIS